MAPAKLLAILLLLFICLKYAHSGKKKGKTIKIHVPYYIKHVHHYKKIYVPKVKVVKHEHHHKKQHEHHHHHDHDHDKAGSEGYYEDESNLHEDFFDEEVVPRGRTRSIRPSRGRGRYRLLASGTEQYKGWRDVDGSEYNGEEVSDEVEDEDDSNEADYVIPNPGPYRHREPSNYITLKRRRKLRKGYASIDRADEDVVEGKDESIERSFKVVPSGSPSPLPPPSPTPIKHVIARITTTSVED